MGKKIKKEIELQLVSSKANFSFINANCVRENTYKYVDYSERPKDIIKAYIEVEPDSIGQYIDLHGADKILKLLKDNL